MMNDMLERYVYAVTKRLPEDQRVEVATELKANINDMLPNNPTAEDVKTVLVSLGEPRKLAAEYRGDKRSLITPEWMSDYLMVLKIVLVILGVVNFVFALIDTLINPEAVTVIGIIAETFAKVISRVLNGMLSGFAIVTLIFTAISNCASKSTGETFNPEKLSAVPKDSDKKISRTGALIELIIGTIMSVILIYLLWHNKTYLVWYDEVSGWNHSLPMFTEEVLKTYIPLFIFALAMAFSNTAVKVVKKEWTVFVAGFHTLYQLASTGIFLAFINTKRLINQVFIAEAANYLSLDASTITVAIARGALGFSIFIGTIIAIDLIATWVKTLKPEKKPFAKH